MITCLPDLHPSLGFLSGIYDEIHRQISDDPSLNSPRVKNLLDDLLDLDGDIMSWSLDTDDEDLPEELAKRYREVMTTAKRLDMLPPEIDADHKGMR